MKNYKILFFKLKRLIYFVLQNYKNIYDYKRILSFFGNFLCPRVPAYRQVNTRTDNSPN